MFLTPSVATVRLFSDGNISVGSTTIVQLYSKLQSCGLFYSMENCSLYEQRERDSFIFDFFHNNDRENFGKLEKKTKNSS